jgi:putative transcriptional regulator
MSINRLRELRTERGWQQAKLAVIAGVSPATVGNIERYGYPASPKLRARIAKALHVKVEDIWPREEAVA